MKEIKIKIKTDNAAFQEQGSGVEAANILSGVIACLHSGRVEAGERKLFDSNGNKVGKVTIK